MKNLKLFAIGAFTAIMVSCGGDKKTETSSDTTASTENNAATSETASATSGDYNAEVGLGEFNESNVDVSKFDAALADKGKAIVDVKCASCHKLTDEKLVGPGWKGITERKKPYWIMNFITNPDPMIDKDPELQKQLEICMTRMPNQNLSKDDARAILEFMRQNDGAK